jgi:hypothetical protein
MDVVVALADDTVISVIQRMVNSGTTVPCLIAMPDTRANYGFGIMFAAQAGASTRPAPDETVTIGSQTTIRTVRASLHPYAAYVPEDWGPQVVFQKALTSPNPTARPPTCELDAAAGLQSLTV